MARFSQDELSRIGARLKEWSERPSNRVNARAIGLSAIVIVMMLVGAQRAPDPVALVRDVAIAFAVAQCIVHLVSLGALRALLRAGVPEAAAALAAYRDPRRLSNLDMAMTWTLVALVAPLVG